MQRLDLSGIYIGDNDEDVGITLALIFEKMTADKQAAFFNYLAARCAEWEKPHCFQWHSMGQDISPGGRALIEEMHDQTKLEA